jgi:cyanophycin synthetase
VSERVAEYRGYWSDAAAMLGASLHDIAPGVWEVRRGAQRTRLVNYVTQCDDPVLLHLAGDKPYGYELAASAGVPVPDHRVLTLRALAEARRFLETTGGPLVVKPAAGSSSGLGVSTGVRTRRELASAMALASLFDDRILVERMVPGESYRILYLGGCAIHAVRRRGTRLTGDGRRTISELLDASGHSSRRNDPVLPYTLAAQQLTLASVPGIGTEILLDGRPPGTASRRELRTVYDESVLARCAPPLLREGAEVVCRLGSELAGVDLITTNPAVPLRAANGAFIEINTTPGIHHHYLPGEDATVPVGVKVLEHLLARRPS